MCPVVQNHSQEKNNETLLGEEVLVPCGTYITIT